MNETMNIWWLWLSTDEIGIELKQLEEEGRDVAPLRAEFKRLIALGNEKLQTLANQAKAQALFDKAQGLKTRKGYAFDEPSDLASIRKLRPRGPRKFKKAISDKAALDHITGAWFGRCIGCMLGKPVEGVRSWDIEGFLKATKQWPLADYITFDVKGKAKKDFPNMVSRKWYDPIDYMPVDDDTNYTTAGFLIVKEKGPGFTPRDVADFWMTRIPMLSCCTAERVAYRNLASNIAPPFSALHRNPFREWIGAQIRADGFGYAAMGNPERAADFAWRDASISHIKNGIYGEMLMAAMIAAAPYCESIEDLIKVGLSEIPRTSRLYADVTKVFDWRKEGISYEDAVKRIHGRWDENSGHDWCHTNTNAVICAVSLLWGEGDFGKSICYAVVPGYDTDCNGATVGSILGMMQGTAGISKKWKARLHNTLKTTLTGYETIAIDKIARETYDLYRKIR